MPHLCLREGVGGAVNHHHHVSLALCHRPSKHCIHHRPQPQACRAGQAGREGLKLGCHSHRIQGGSCGHTTGATGVLHPAGGAPRGKKVTQLPAPCVTASISSSW